MELELEEYNKLYKNLIENIDNLNLIAKDLDTPKNVNDSLTQHLVIKNIEVKIKHIIHILSIIKKYFNKFQKDDFIEKVEKIENKLNIINNKITEHKLKLFFIGIIYTKSMSLTVINNQNI
jgi:hypothetical protein